MRPAPTTVPTRFVHVPEATARFGDQVKRLGPLFLRGDDLADDAARVLAELGAAEREPLLARALKSEEGAARAPLEVRRFAESLHHVPFWVSSERTDRGGRAMLRTGVFGVFALAFRSLIVAYCSPAGNKPLAFSGRLTQNAPRRLSETGRFIQAVCQPGGLRPGEGGFVAAARVRLMHAQVRRLLAVSPKWNAGAWGVPINQVDMAGTTLLFSLQVCDAVRALGAPFNDQDAEDLQHLWRYVGYLMGVEEELLATSVYEARALWGMILATQGPPDADSAALAKALIESQSTQALTPQERERARRFTPIAYGLARYLAGDEFADGLGFPKSMWRFAGPALATLMSRAGRLARKLPGAEQLMVEAGVGYWRRTVDLGLGSEDARFDMPDGVQHA